MALIVLQLILQSVTSTLSWVGLYVGVRALPDGKTVQRRWITGPL